MKEQADSQASSSEDIAKLLKPDYRVWMKLEKQGKPLCLVFDARRSGAMGPFHVGQTRPYTDFWGR